MLDETMLRLQQMLSLPKDIPDQAVAVGVPATVISYEGSQDFIIAPKSSDG